MSPLLADIVAKVGGPLQVSNFRIQRAPRLNQSCATDPFLESMLRVRMRKIFLQQNRHKADIRGTATFCPLWGNSGQRWIVARDGLSAYDPERTSRAVTGFRHPAYPVHPGPNRVPPSAPGLRARARPANARSAHAASRRDRNAGSR